MKRILVATWLTFLVSWVHTAEAQVDEGRMTPVVAKSLNLAVEFFNNKGHRYLYNVWSLKIADEMNVSGVTFVDLLFEIKETRCRPEDIRKPNFALSACRYKKLGRMYRCQACFTSENLEDIPKMENVTCIAKKDESQNPPNHPYCMIWVKFQHPGVHSLSLDMESINPQKHQLIFSELKEILDIEN